METANQLNQLDDLELLGALCSVQDDDLLYAEFVRRFLPELKEECRKICTHRKLDPHIGNQITHEVFEKLRKYKSFKTNNANKSDPHKRILVYLYRIARNLFNDWYNDNRKNSHDCIRRSYFDALTETIHIPDTPDILKWKRDTAGMIFKKLNQKEQAVVLADIDYKKSQVYLPDEITEHLAASLGVEKSSIRKIRERAISKIKKAIHEINQQ